jgi:hypothetical protein
MWVDGVCIGVTIGGSRYHIGIIKKKIERISVDITRYVVTPGGG